MTKRCKVSPGSVADLATMDAVEFRRMMDELDASLDAMANLLGIARRNVADYRKNKPIPAAIALATRQIRALA